MTTYGNTVLQANEDIPITVRAESIMRGKNRTLIKSELKPRQIGYWKFGVKNIGIHPSLMVPPLTDPVDIANSSHELYTAQVNYHRQIDVLLLEITADHAFSGGGAGGHSPLTLLFKNNAMLPPNKNVYFVSAPDNPINDGLHSNNFSATLGTGDVNHTNGISTFWDLYPPSFFITRNPFQKSGSVYWTGLPTNDIAFIRRTDANGKIPDMDQRFSDHLEFGLDHAYFDGYGIGSKFRVYEIKDRYNCNETYFPFFQRKYQAWTDNEWDTKVAADA